MDEINTLLDLDIGVLIIGLVCLLGIIVRIIQQTGVLKKTFGIKTRRDIEHDLLIQTSQNLAALQEQHTKDDERIRSELQNFTSEVRDAINILNGQMERYHENRIHDRAQSFEIQKQINDRSDDRDKKIEALMLGSMELLGDKIDQRFSRYVALDGIPENEVDEFDGIFAAYQALNGNHKREEKYKYVKNHMKVIPVESKLKIDE